MRARDRRVLASHLENLLVHLLKWHYQPEGRQTGHSWADSIREARIRLAAGLSDAYTDSPQFHDSAVRRYRTARRKAQPPDWPAPSDLPRSLSLDGRRGSC